MNQPNNRIREEWIEKLEKLMELDVMSYSTMSGHPQCKIDPYKLRDFIAELLKSQKEEERRFILNVLDGIDKADEELGNKGGGTKAIRLALQSRI